MSVAATSRESGRDDRSRTTGLTVRAPDPLAVGAAAIGLVALPTGWSVVSLLVAVGLTSRHVPGGSVVRRSAIAVLVLLSVNAVVLSLLAVLGARPDPRWAVAAYLLLEALASGTRSGHRRAGSSTARQDLWALAALVVTFAVLAHTVVGASAAQLSARLAVGTDGGTHLMLVRAVMRERGYIGLRPDVPGILPGIVDYPSGWAAGMAVTLRLLLGPEPGPAPFLGAASLLICAGYALLAFFATAVALDVARAAAGRLSTAALALGLLCTLVPAVTGVTTLLYGTQAYAQTAATALLLAVLSVVLHPSSGSRAGTVVLALLSVGLFHAWYLLAPVLAAVLLVHLLQVRPHARTVLICAIVAAPFAAYPVLTGPRPGSHVLSFGVTPGLSPTGGTALLVLVVVVLLALLQPSSAGRSQRLLLATSVVACTLAVAGVVLLQERGSGDHYYAVKLLYTLSVLTVVASAAVAAAHVACSAPGRRAVGASVLVLGVLACLAVSSYGVRGLAVTVLTGIPGSPAGESALREVFARHASWVPEDTDTWILSECSRSKDRKTTQLVTSLSLGWDADRLATFNTFIRADDGDISMLLDRADDPGVRGMEVYVSRRCLPDGLASLAARPGVIVVHV